MRPTVLMERKAARREIIANPICLGSQTPNAPLSVPACAHARRAIAHAGCKQPCHVQPQRHLRRRNCQRSLFPTLLQWRAGGRAVLASQRTLRRQAALQCCRRSACRRVLPTASAFARGWRLPRTLVAVPKQLHAGMRGICKLHAAGLALQHTAEIRVLGALRGHGRFQVRGVDAWVNSQTAQQVTLRHWCVVDHHCS